MPCQRPECAERDLPGHLEALAALTQMKEAPSRLTEDGLSDPQGRFFRLSPPQEVINSVQPVREYRMTPQRRSRAWVAARRNCPLG